MPDREPPPSYQTAAEVLDRARALFGQADQLVREGLREDPGGRWVNDQVLTRAASIAQVAAAGALLGQELLVLEDEAAATDLDQHLGPYPTPLGSPSEELQQHLEDLAARPLRDPDGG